jgi:hypothetical protein
LPTANFGLITDISYGCLTIFERNTCTAPLSALQQAANPHCIRFFCGWKAAKTKPRYILIIEGSYQISRPFFFRTDCVNFFWEWVANFCKLGIGKPCVWITCQMLWVRLWIAGDEI